MCGRFSLAVDIQTLPNQFADSVLNRGSEEYLQQRDNPSVYTRQNGGHNSDSPSEPEIVLALSDGLDKFSAAYNIPPTKNSVIVYQKEHTNKRIEYCFEIASFGLLPVWAKPNDSTPVKRKGHNGLPYSKEVGGMQSKYFNCRKETLAKGVGVWNSAKKFRCVVPIQGYFEWRTENGEKTPYYVHSKKYPLLFLAAFYAHNYHYEAHFQSKSNGYVSSFTIITGPATKADVGDISWLHPRKPIMLLPGSQEWDDWLDPSIDWDDKLLSSSLDTKSNKAYEELALYRVSKDVGSPVNQGKYLIEEIKNKGGQKSLDGFFRKRAGSEDKRKAKKVKTEIDNEHETLPIEEKKAIKIEDNE